MAIVVFGGEKGGTGKTTLATNLAAMLALKGRDVLLLDTDRQGTASLWATVRAEEKLEPLVPCVQKFGTGLPSQIRDLAKRYQEVIIDAGGRDSLELRYALGVADRAYIPVQPFQFDIWTVRQMDSLVGMAKTVNEGLQAHLVLNRVSTNPVVREDQEARDFVGREGFDHLRLLALTVRDRIAFRKSARDGRGVVELAGDRKAIAEITELYEEIYGDTKER